MGNTGDPGARNTCPLLPKRAATFPLCRDCSGQPSQEQLSALEGKHCEQCLFTLLFTLKSIYLPMFKSTQSKLWMTATSCSSQSTAFITTEVGLRLPLHGGECRAPCFRIASLGKTQTNTSLEAAGFLFTVSPEFPAEKQLEPYSVLWFYCCFQWA